MALTLHVELDIVVYDRKREKTLNFIISLLTDEIMNWD